MEELTSKEEKVVVMDDNGDRVSGAWGGRGGSGSGGGGGGGGVEGSCSLSMSKTLLLKPRIRNHEYPSKFVLKTFEMVDNPETNSIISWSPTGTSLIIWDLIKFSELLPIYFKHNHFSSFNYQLNNYGFRKISWDKWEYENPWFQEGKKHLLDNIQRKNKQVSVTKKQQVAKNRCFDSGEEFRMKDKLENVRNDNMKLRVEIQNLKLQQENMENQFAALEEHMTDMECKQQKMIIFIANKFNPSFFQQFIHQLRQKMEVDSTQTAKKRKLVVPQSTKTSMEPMNMDAMDTTLINGKLGSPIQNQKANATLDINADDYQCWNKLLEDDSMCENELEVELRLAHSKMVMEFEDLIEKPRACGVEEEGNVDLWS